LKQIDNTEKGRVSPMKNTNTDMGYVYISENALADQHKLAKNIDTFNKDGVFYITFDTNLQSFGDINRNKRSYIGSNIWECIQAPKIQALLRDNCWFGEFDHPTPEYKGQQLSPERMQTVPPKYRCFKIMKPRIVGDLLQAKVQSSQTDIGIGWGKEILAGWLPSFSLRAIASLKLMNGKPTVVARRVITYDSVWYPSHERAHAISAPRVVSKKINAFTESVKDGVQSAVEAVIIPLKEILESVGTKDVNTQMIMETFDLGPDSLIGFDQTKEHVVLKDELNTIYAKISPKTKKDVDDFFSSFNI
jgi:hypothetical protein